MILTTLGIDQVNRDLETKITRVVFSDLSLHYVMDPSSLTDVTGGNTNSVEPVIGLLYNGALNIQATNNAQFKAQSAFIYAQNDKEFLIAVSLVRNNKVDCELRINSLRKLSFNAIAANLVTKSDIREAMGSAIADKANVTDLDSYIKKDAIHIEFNSLTDSIVSAATSSNAIILASKADSSMVDSKLASKANLSELSNYATKASLSSVVDAIPSAIDLSSYVVADSLSNYATNSALTSYATTSLVKSIASDNNKSISNVSSKFSDYATNDQLSSVVEKIPSSANLSGYVTDDMLKDYATNSKLESVVSSIPARVDLSSYVTSDKLSEYATNKSLNDYVKNNELSSYATNSKLSSAVNSIDLSSYVTNDKLSSYALNSELSNYATNNQLNSYATNEQLSSVANTIPASVNLSGYVTESTLSSYVLNSDLSKYATSNELVNLKNALSIYATTSDVYSAASNYATNSYADSVAKSAAIGATNWINILSAGIDLNKVTGVGRHVLLPNNNYINFPPSLNKLNEAYMHVIPDNFGNVSQHVVCYGDSIEAVRFKSNGVWTDWLTGATLEYVNTAVANLNDVINNLSSRLDNWVPSPFKTTMYNAKQAPIDFDITSSVYPNGTIYKADNISGLKGMPTDLINNVGIPANSPALVFYNHETGNANGGWKILNIAVIKDYVIFAFNILAKTSNAKDFKSSSSLLTTWGQGWLNYNNKVGAAPFIIANGTVTTR